MRSMWLADPHAAHRIFGDHVLAELDEGCALLMLGGKICFERANVSRPASVRGVPSGHVVAVVDSVGCRGHGGLIRSRHEEGSY